MFTWEETEDAIQAAIVATSGLASTQVIWGYQNVGSPPLDFIEVSLGALLNIGQDYVKTSVDLGRTAGQEIKQEVKGTREVSLDMQFFTSATMGSANARALGERVRSGFVLPSVRYSFQKVGVSVFGPGVVNYVPDIPTVNFRGRATCSVRCYMPAITVAEYVGYIAKVNGTFFVQGITGSTGLAIPFSSTL